MQTELVSLSTLAARRHVSAQDLDAGRPDHVRGGIAGTKRELIAIVRSGNGNCFPQRTFIELIVKSLTVVTLGPDSFDQINRMIIVTNGF